MPQMTESTMNTPGTDPIVELHDVRFSYDTGAHWTLDGIDLTSQDVAIAIKAGLEKDRWFLSAHLAA